MLSSCRISGLVQTSVTSSSACPSHFFYRTDLARARNICANEVPLARRHHMQLSTGESFSTAVSTETEHASSSGRPAQFAIAFFKLGVWRPPVGGSRVLDHLAVRRAFSRSALSLSTLVSMMAARINVAALVDRRRLFVLRLNSGRVTI